ncbi:MAG: hypothetical protein IJ435_08820 [Clostridia bacterium]|nr:hypothetical protein [Clostridia bacterium]
MKAFDLSGEYELRLNNEVYTVTLPGTLDENGIGEQEKSAEKWHPDAAIEENDETQVITTRFTRRFAYEGECEFVKSFAYEPKGKRAFIKVERTRQLKLFVNGCEAKEYVKGSLSTPYVFEVTDLLKKENEIVFKCSNLYDNLPKDAIKFSSAATNETQTNWLGILGEIILYEEEESFISSVKVYPGEDVLNVAVLIDANEEKDIELTLKSNAIQKASTQTIKLAKGINKVHFDNVPINANAEKWDEYEGNLYALTVSSACLEEKSVKFGIRTFSDDGLGHLSLNGRRIFIRSEANCCVFADTGHMPLKKEDWIDKLALYKAYGINTVRFHSHCPPEGAFAAADEMGMIIQPELSNWDPKHAFESEESVKYYEAELWAILDFYANHPSFCMLTFGNELKCNEVGLARLRHLADKAREADKTRLYAIASNEFYGAHGAEEHSDFYTASNYYDHIMRGTNSGMQGHINNIYPNTKTDYSMVMAKIRERYKKPVFSFEVGQYEVLPDFKELDKFNSFLIADNIQHVKDKVEEKGLLPKWEKWVEASGELSLIAYREEVEACMRTEDMSGISLLGLQDFPGQGTALVGMINSHFEPKDYAFAKPERFKSFFRSQLPLVKMDRFTYTRNENLCFEVLFANYGKEDVCGMLTYSLKGVEEVACGEVCCKKSGLTGLGEFVIPLKEIDKSAKYMLTVSVGNIKNEYPVWVYTDEEYSIGNVIVCQTCDEAIEKLKEGKRVFLSPPSDKEHFPRSIKTHFTTDFWSVGTFPFQEGYMGCSLDPAHAIFRHFPTEGHSNWQWWQLTNSYAMILPDDTDPVFDVLDSCLRLRKLGFLVEAEIEGGKLLLSSMGLLEKTHYPEVRAMLKSIFSYMNSDSFNPKQKLTKEQLKSLTK